MLPTDWGSRSYTQTLRVEIVAKFPVGVVLMMGTMFFASGCLTAAWLLVTVGMVRSDLRERT